MSSYLSTYLGVLCNYHDPNCNVSITWSFSFLRLNFDLDCTPVRKERSHPCEHEAGMMLDFPWAEGSTELQPKAQQHRFSFRDKIRARREQYLFETSILLSTPRRNLLFNTLLLPTEQSRHYVRQQWTLNEKYKGIFGFAVLAVLTAICNEHFSVSENRRKGHLILH